MTAAATPTRRGYGARHRRRRSPAATPFGRLLRRLRDARGLTALEIQRRGGPHHSHLSRLETGERPPTNVANLARLADALRLTPDERIALIEAAGFPIGTGGGTDGV